MAGRHSENPLAEGSEGELNLIPYLDIMVNLVIFLIFTFQVIVEMNVIDLMAPAFGKGDTAQDDAKPPRSITLVISKSGYKVLSSDVTMGFLEIPLKNGEYATEQLSEKLSDWKETYELGNSMIMTADMDVKYDLVVRTMDAVRKMGDRSLFPGVMLSRVAPSGGG